MPVRHNDRSGQQRVAVSAQVELDLSWSFLSVFVISGNYESIIFIPKYDNSWIILEKLPKIWIKSPDETISARLTLFMQIVRYFSRSWLKKKIP
jgi:hypothetical protein